MTDQELETFVEARLRGFFEARLAKLKTISLPMVLKKNPYLFRAKGVTDAADFVENVLQAYLSSSEETIFGNRFFEPLALKASEAKGGMKTGSTGVDIEYSTPNTHTAIAVKSATNSQNASAQGKQNLEFIKIQKTVQARGKAFDAIIAYCYGRATGGPSDKVYRRLAGQAFWQELTGDGTFYLKIIRAMRDLPQQHRQEYDAARTSLKNRLAQAFMLNFLAPDGGIDWEKLLEFNSGAGKPAKLVSVAQDSTNGHLVLEMKLVAESELESDLEELE